MTPSIDDRLASVVRALSEVITPHLPADASLALEQAQLAIGHLQIIRAQLDAAPAFEREELGDAIDLAEDLVAQLAALGFADPALDALDTARAQAGRSDQRNARLAIVKAIDALTLAIDPVSQPVAHACLTRVILAHERVRAGKDRAWFAPFGFDTV